MIYLSVWAHIMATFARGPCSKHSVFTNVSRLCGASISIAVAPISSSFAWEWSQMAETKNSTERSGCLKHFGATVVPRFPTKSHMILKYTKDLVLGGLLKNVADIIQSDSKSANLTVIYKSHGVMEFPFPDDFFFEGSTSQGRHQGGVSDHWSNFMFRAPKSEKISNRHRHT